MKLLTCKYEQISLVEASVKNKICVNNIVDNKIKTQLDQGDMCLPPCLCDATAFISL